MAELNQPDPEKLQEQVEDMQDLTAKLAGLLQNHQRIIDAGVLEFATDEGVSSETCAAAMANFDNMRRLAARLSYKIAVQNGQAWFFLPVGINEGDSPPCEC